jgi:hypothetical protein
MYCESHARCTPESQLFLTDLDKFNRDLLSENDCVTAEEASVHKVSPNPETWEYIACM